MLEISTLVVTQCILKALGFIRRKKYCWKFIFKNKKYHLQFKIIANEKF